MLENALKLLGQRVVQVQSITENVPSPCVSVCRMDLGGTHCEGCLRTLDEIRIWSVCSDEEKKTIWTHIAQRLRSHV